jgi:hypothetical protein
MPETKTIPKHIYDVLTEAGWPDLVFDESRDKLTCPIGEIIKKQGKEYILKFIFYSQERSEYGEGESYGVLVFPTDFDIKRHLYFRRTGNYSISLAKIFKNIVNPLGKTVEKIKISSTATGIRFMKTTLVIPQETFLILMADAKRTSMVADAYKKSTETYLANQYSRKYSSRVRKRTTYLDKGEFKFLVDRFYLKTKKKKNDYLNYLNADDLSSIEELMTQLLRDEVLSPDFIRFLDEYFIKEKLKEIVGIGRQILSLKTENTGTLAAKKVIDIFSTEPISQFEGIWQKYFENYLLYLIFTYKKIFPKVELENIQGEKKYPDFIGVNHYNGLDVIEIKTHLKNILVWDRSHKNFYFSPEMSKAIVQTNNYLDAIIQRRFQSSDDENKITNFVDEENLYHPRGIIIISSTERITTKTGKDEELRRDFTKLRNSLQNITILTFDEILGIADEYIKNITPNTEG